MGKPVTMTENRLAIRRAFLDGKINAVCGYPGIGKTYLTMIHPTFIDGFFSKQYYTDKKKGIVNPDSLKTMLGSVLRLLSEVRLSCVLCTRRHVKCSTASGCRI